jgi:molybdopterin synthase sulfur carrier subunit
MAVLVKIPTQLRAAAGGETETEVDGATVQEVLDGLFDRFDELRARISDDDGSLRRFVNVYLAGEDIRFLDGLDTRRRRGGVDDPSSCRRGLLARRDVLDRGAGRGGVGRWGRGAAEADRRDEARRAHRGDRQRPHAPRGEPAEVMGLKPGPEPGRG